MRLDGMLSTLDALIDERQDAVKRLNFAQRERKAAFERAVPKPVRDGWRVQLTADEKRIIAEHDETRDEHVKMFAALQNEIWTLQAAKVALVTEDHLHKALHPIHR